VLLVQGMPEFVFANRSGLEMFETTSSSLQELDWEKTLNENDCKLSYATFTQVLQQVGVSPLLLVTCTVNLQLQYSKHVIDDTPQDFNGLANFRIVF